jgi:hypothetical protein
MSRLEELYLCGHSFDIDEDFFGLTTFHHLRVLHCERGNYESALSGLAANRSLGRLERLHLYPWNYSYVDTIPGNEVVALIRSRHLKSLTHLELHYYDGGDEICRAIARSGILKRLELLQLQFGDITDEGACRLAKSPDLKHLERLDLSANAIMDAGLEALRKTGVNLVAEGQVDPSTWEDLDEFDEDWE